MKLINYLKPVQNILSRPEQQDWFDKLEKKSARGFEIYNSADGHERQRLHRLLDQRIRTEELKAWYGEPEGDSLFQGTSVTALTIPHVVNNPIEISSIEHLEEVIADAYIKLHRKHECRVLDAIQEDISEWLNRGLYYGVVICSKVIAQAFGLSIHSDEVIFDVRGQTVDPHEITSCSPEVREAYFKKCIERIEHFQGLDLTRQELEACLSLADISKPKISSYKNKIILAPVLCNEIAALLSERVSALIREKSGAEINPRGLSVVIYDTDTPYTYHAIMGFRESNLCKVLPGLVVLGASGTIDALRWLYTYRLSLVSQKIQKGSLYSEVHRRFIPFVFYGVLVWRDAEILLDMDNLHRLRYRGNLHPELEASYLLSSIANEEPQPLAGIDWNAFHKKHKRGANYR